MRVILFSFLFLLVSCIHTKPQVLHKTQNKFTLVGKNFINIQDKTDHEFVRYLSFDTDSTGTMLIGGDVLEATSYTVLEDSIKVQLISFPKYSHTFFYKNDTLIDNQNIPWWRK